MDLSHDPRLAAFLAAQAKYSANQDLSQDRRSSTVLLSCISISIAFISLVLRFWARFRKSFGYGLDDWLIVASFCFMLGNLACVITTVRLGVGLHSSLLTLEKGMMVSKIIVLNEILYVTNINLIKLSVLSMYYRFFPIRQVRIAGTVVGMISSLWNVSLIILALIQCIPFKKIYAPWVDGACIDQRKTFLIIAIPSIITDIAILSIPMPHVWKLQSTIWQKVSLTSVFLLGSFVVFASIYRFITFIDFDDHDPTYTIAPGLAWNMIELGSGILSANLPTLGPFLRKFLKKIGASTSGFGKSYFKSSTSSKALDECKSENRTQKNNLLNPEEASLSVACNDTSDVDRVDLGIGIAHSHHLESPKL